MKQRKTRQARRLPAAAIRLARRQCCAVCCRTCRPRGVARSALAMTTRPQRFSPATSCTLPASFLRPHFPQSRARALVCVYVVGVAHATPRASGEQEDLFARQHSRLGYCSASASSARFSGRPSVTPCTSCHSSSSSPAVACAPPSSSPTPPPCPECASPPACRACIAYDRDSGREGGREGVRE